MAEKLYCIAGVGQSNLEPKGLLFGAGEYFELVPELNYTTLIPYGGDPLYGKASDKLLFLTFYYPENSAGAYPGVAPPYGGTYDKYAKWLPWTHLEGPVDNPHPLGFRYPNAFNRPLGEVKDGIAVGNPPTRAFPQAVSLLVDLGVRLNGLLGKRIGLINASVDASQLQMRETPLGNTPAQWGWFDDRYHVTWAPPATRGLFTRFGNMLDASKLAAADQGYELDLVAVTVSLMETDKFFQQPSASEQYEKNVPEFVDALRQLVFDKGLCRCQPKYLPVIWEKMGTDLDGAAFDVAGGRAVIDALVKDDICFGSIDNNGVDKIDVVHYSSAGIRTRGANWVEEFQRLRSAVRVAFPMNEAATLAELRSKVRLEAQRNGASIDLEDDVIDKAVNDYLDTIFQTVGDLAWWVRHIVQHEVSVSSNDVIDLPRTVHRLLDVFDSSFPDTAIPWTMIGHVDNGRTRIKLGHAFSGSLDLHSIFEPREMIASDEKAVLPRRYVNALVAGASWRVVHTLGNDAQEIKLQRTAAIMLERLNADCNKVERQRRMSVSSRRRYRRNGFSGPSWNGGR